MQTILPSSLLEKSEPQLLHVSVEIDRGFRSYSIADFGVPKQAATQYCLNQWEKLELYTLDGWLKKTGSYGSIVIGIMLLRNLASLFGGDTNTAQENILKNTSCGYSWKTTN